MTLELSRPEADALARQLERVIPGRREAEAQVRNAPAGASVWKAAELAAFAVETDELQAVLDRLRCDVDIHGRTSMWYELRDRHRELATMVALDVEFLLGLRGLEITADNEEGLAAALGVVRTDLRWWRAAHNAMVDALQSRAAS